MSLPIKKLAGCVIYDEDGKILLLHRYKPVIEWWELPGGKIDEEETAEQTAIRETKEELGVDVEVVKALGNEHFVIFDTDWDYYWFEAQIKNEQHPKIGEPETFNDLMYFSIDELKGRSDLSPNVVNLLKTLR